MGVEWPRIEADKLSLSSDEFKNVSSYTYAHSYTLKREQDKFIFNHNISNSRFLTTITFSELVCDAV